MALSLIAWIAIVGVGFSGYLSYKELFTGNCEIGGVYCGSKIGLIAGLPACVYGLAMYFTLLVVSILGVLAKKSR